MYFKSLLPIFYFGYWLFLSLSCLEELLITEPLLKGILWNQCVSYFLIRGTEVRLV